MATIEPRLIHLLNDNERAGYVPPNALPPLQPFSYSRPAALPVSLPSLGLELDKRAEQLPSKIAPIPAAPQHIPSFSSIVGDDAPRRPAAAPLARAPNHEYDGSARLKNAHHSIRALLEDANPVDSSHSLRMILADDATPPETATEDPSTKKRHRAMTVKDDFVQLPQPLKKQKSAQQVMPPIINGLHEPPPNASFFPPISAVDFGNKESLSLNPLKELGAVPDERPAAPATPTDDKPPGGVKTRRRTKPRRKWTELETNHLLLGVSRHGVGKWTNILEDPDFHFVDRTAGDLKDRFRTCCPDELRGSNGSIGVKATAFKENSQEKATAPTASSDPSSAASAPSDSQPRAKRTLNLENLLVGDEDPDCDAASPTWFLPETDAPADAAPDTAPKPRKSRAHRKKLEDLAELGICGPFKKSHRRERRPFTEQDDKEILEGINRYGPAWTRIQRDESFNLSSRQPTDLRDRVRNKYPEIYARIEKGGIQIKDPSRSVGVLEPMVNTTIENSLDPQLNRSTSKDNILRWTFDPVVDTTSASHQHPFDLHDHHASTYQGNVGEMDISRLLLYDSQQV